MLKCVTTFRMSVIRQGVDILMEKLWPIETSRFLSFLPRKRIESVKRHQEWQSELDKNKFLNDLF